MRRLLTTDEPVRRIPNRSALEFTTPSEPLSAPDTSIDSSGNVECVRTATASSCKCDDSKSSIAEEANRLLIEFENRFAAELQSLKLKIERLRNTCCGVKSGLACTRARSGDSYARMHTCVRVHASAHTRECVRSYSHSNSKQNSVYARGASARAGNAERIPIFKLENQINQVVEVESVGSAKSAIRVADMQLELKVVNEPNWSELEDVFESEAKDELARLVRGNEEVASKMAEWANSGKKQPRQRYDRTKTKEELDAALDSCDWKSLKPKHAVELYAAFHNEVYGFEPEEFAPGSRDLDGALRMAAEILKRSFGGDIEELITFVGWVWSRERSRHKWRKENKVPLKRVHWRWQFGPSMLSDYRMEKLKKAGD